MKLNCSFDLYKIQIKALCGSHVYLSVCLSVSLSVAKYRGINRWTDCLKLRNGRVSLKVAVKFRVSVVLIHN
jgi:hypothetical protein